MISFFNKIENQRAGLWRVCNKTSKIDNNLDGLYMGDNENATQLIRSKISKARDLFIKVNGLENCYSKFILKEGKPKIKFNHLIAFDFFPLCCFRCSFGCFGSFFSCTFFSHNRFGFNVHWLYLFCV